MEIDTSQLNTYISCPREYKYKYEMGLQKIGRDEEAYDLIFGTHVHKAIETYFKHDKESALKYLDNNYTFSIDKVKTPEMAKICVEDFIPWFGHNFKDIEILSNEIKDTYNVCGLDYIVKIDMVIRWGGSIFAVDFKTTGTSNAVQYFMRFEPNLQPMAYVKYLKQKYGSCAGFIPIVFFCGHRSRAYKGEPAGYHCNIDYRIVNIDDNMIDNFDYVVGDWAERLVYDGTKPPNYSSCHRFGGCQFRELCLSLGDEDTIKNRYEVVDTKAYLKGE